jgi:hypothetical protein
MTHEGAHRLFRRLRASFARVYPVGDVSLVVTPRHFLASPSARDLGWYETGDRTVYVVSRLLKQHPGRVAGVLAHELGHAADPTPNATGAERRADAIAFEVLGQPILYDKGFVQNLDHGVAPRPSHLHQ